MPTDLPPAAVNTPPKITNYSFSNCMSVPKHPVSCKTHLKECNTFTSSVASLIPKFAGQACLVVWDAGG